MQRNGGMWLILTSIEEQGVMIYTKERYINKHLESVIYILQALESERTIYI
jgi:hypothetical protein